MGSLKSLVLPQQLLQWELWDWRKRHNRLSVLNHIVDVRHSWGWHVSYEVTWLLEIISLLHSKKLLSQSHNDSQERTNSDGGAGLGILSLCILGEPVSFFLFLFLCINLFFGFLPHHYRPIASLMVRPLQYSVILRGEGWKCHCSSFVWG